MASLADAPAKIVFSESSNCMVCSIPEGPADIYSGFGLGGFGLSGFGGKPSLGSRDTSDPGTPTKLKSTEDAASLKSSGETSLGRTALRSKAAAFVPAATAAWMMAGAPGLAAPGFEPPVAETLSERIDREGITTLMLRNVPHSWSRASLIELLDSKGLLKLYDFVYVPVNIRTELNAGYAFVNMITPEAAKLFAEAFHGFSGRDPTVEDDCAVCVSEVQGLGANIKRYQNSPIMSAEVPDAYKPALFRDGEPVVFPAPTQPLRSLRLRMGKRNQPQKTESEYTGPTQ